MKINEDVLDNPVWNSKTDTHFNEGIDYGNVKFYKHIIRLLGLV